ncbi:M67 family metallopeptidase [Alkalihalophilus pseudofirmus]|uniref:M67 family metallopeptidase n=1 Tax=Alkalihalophilus pseudofirmus TaxID=79885 RepID=UPI00259B1B13|nr:M67 family metallopeptidase [Alkalihalophilus pseudofirmus]WEG15370.1 M67 family metallopeptidase [Alkalihalophilus pseudofirmus]
MFIKASIYQEVINHCQSELPYEGCGLLSGSEGVITSCWPVTNIQRSPTSFAMSNSDMLRVFEEMEKLNEEFLGIFHSHPTAKAYPSHEDIIYNPYPEKGYLIISFLKGKPVLKCYRFKGKEVYPVEVVQI